MLMFLFLTFVNLISTLWALMAKKKGQDPDNLTFAQAMVGPYKQQFKAAQKKEIKELTTLETFEVVAKDEAKP